MEQFYQQYPELCRPLHIGKFTLRNRMCSAPMGFPDLTEDGCLTDGAIAFYENRAKGGAAIVTISEACVDYQHGKSHGRLINLQNPGCLAELTNAARAIQRHGALASIEINHSGMLSEFDVVTSEKKGDGLVHFGPEDIILPNSEKVKGMTEADISYTLEQYRLGVRMIRKAGFDIIMIHAGHGWLIHQFLSPLTNHRTDAYGGSIEKRAKLLMDIIDTVRDEAKGKMLIDVRISGMETTPGGITLEDTVKVCKLIEKKVDMLHISAGNEGDFDITHPPMFAEPGCNVKYAAEIKKQVSIPVATVGALNEPQQLEDIISSGKSDIICMARALLADPELPKKVEQNRTDEILRCMRCFVCHAERMLTQTRVCALNPEIGREYESKFERSASEPKKVLIAGAGPAGIQCALTAKKRGHHVIICEKEDTIGGKINCETEVSFKPAFGKYISTMMRRLEISGIDLRLGTEVTPDYVRSIAPDVLIMATGAYDAVPQINITSDANCFYATRFEISKIKGSNVVVIGGGQTGCELAAFVASLGKKVTIIEMTDLLARDANPRHRPLLLKELNRLNVNTVLNSRASEITPTFTEYITAKNEHVTVASETAIIAAGLKKDDAYIDSFRGIIPEFQIIGDCEKVSNIRGATFRGYHAALDI